MRYQAVIFDLDGTLLNTIEDIADAVNSVLAPHGFPTHSLEKFKQMVGLGLEQLIVDALPESARDAQTLEKVLAEAGEAYAAHWKNKTRPYPGVVALLGELKTRGLKLAVLSNKPQRFTLASVSALLPPHTFDAVLGAVEDLPKKPAPDGALRVARELGVLPEHFLYVGDSGTDMRTAKAAGMFAVGVTWGFRTEQELRENGADAILSHPEALLRFLV